jgi:hypothetical protein
VRLDKELKELELKKQKELELEQLREKEQIIIEQTKKEIREEKENLTQHPKETDNEDNIQKKQLVEIFISCNDCFDTWCRWIFSI